MAKQNYLHMLSHTQIPVHKINILLLTLPLSLVVNEITRTKLFESKISKKKKEKKKNFIVGELNCLRKEHVSVYACVCV